MARFLFCGRLTLAGVTFIVEAETPEMAQALAAQGHYEEYEVAGATLADWNIDTMTLEEDA